VGRTGQRPHGDGCDHAARGSRRSVDLTFSDDDGQRGVTIARAHDISQIRFAADDRRVAYTRPTCTQQTLTVASLDQLPAPASLSRCPLQVTTHRVRVSPSGRVRVPVACPRGCRLEPGIEILILRHVGSAINERGVVVRKSGGAARLAFTLPKRTRRRLKARHLIRAQVVLTGIDGTRSYHRHLSLALDKPKSPTAPTPRSTAASAKAAPSCAASPANAPTTTHEGARTEPLPPMSSMTLQPITYCGRTAAAATRLRFLLAARRRPMSVAAAGQAAPARSARANVGRRVLRESEHHGRSAAGGGQGSGTWTIAARSCSTWAA